MPELEGGPVTNEYNAWMGRAMHLVSEAYADDRTSAVPGMLALACQNLIGHARQAHASRIATFVYQALARAESRAPAGMQGAFIAAGAPLDALLGVARIFASAQHRLLIVDPYLGAKVFADFLPAAPVSVRIDLLSDRERTKPDTLRPFVERWQAQHGAARPIEARQTPRDALHDRLVIVDDNEVWSLTQSLKDLAARSPASLLRVDDETASLKRAHYLGAWDSATPIA